MDTLTSAEELANVVVRSLSNLQKVVAVLERMLSTGRKQMSLLPVERARRTWGTRGWSVPPQTLGR